MTADILVRKEGFSLYEMWPLRHFDEPTQGQNAATSHSYIGNAAYLQSE